MQSKQLVVKNIPPEANHQLVRNQKRTRTRLIWIEQLAAKSEQPKTEDKLPEENQQLMQMQPMMQKRRIESEQTRKGGTLPV